MAQRRHHYEQAFEEYLRARRIPYVSVNEARKALLPGAANAGNPRPAAIKSFDFVVYGQDENLLLDIKGRRLHRRAAVNPFDGPGRLESWATLDDVESLRRWTALFGPGFDAAFVFVYWCDAQPPDALFHEVFARRERWYTIRAVRLEAYAAHMRTRSARWRTVHLSRTDFDRVSQPFCPAPGDAPTPPAAPLAALQPLAPGLSSES